MTKSNSIAFASTQESAPWGGSEELWSQAATLLARRGVQIEVCFKEWGELSSPKLRELQQVGARVHWRQSLQPTKAERLKLMVARYAGSKPGKPIPPDWQWLIDAPPKLLCVSLGSLHDRFDWFPLASQAKTPYVLVLQSHTESRWPSDEEADQWLQIFGGARAACFVSRHNQKLLEIQMGATLPNAHIIRNPINVSRMLAPAWPASDGAWKLACVGRLAPDCKGQDLLLQALAQPRWQDRPITVDFFGGGVCQRALQRLAQQLGVARQVCFAGFVPDVAGIWAAHHALVLPSRIEGLPLALVEAMLCARPAIVTEAGGNTEMLSDGVEGFVARSPTVELLDEALERAWERRAQWPDMGLRARQRALREVPEDPAAVFVDLLDSLSQ